VGGQGGGAVAAVGSLSARVSGYRTRRPMRAVALAAMLSIVAGVVWLSVLHQTETACQSDGSAAADLNSSAQRLPPNGLDAVAPGPPQLTRVQVLNANGIHGEATIVDDGLARLGFAPTTRPANDPLHPDFDMHCYAEIRFGAAGQGAARTLSLAVPCAELVRDIRPDAEVDLALGTKFIGLRPNDAARTALLDLAGLGQTSPLRTPRGGLAAQPDAQQVPPAQIAQSVPVVNPDLVRRARQVPC
jgi:hypothetical protein